MKNGGRRRRGGIRIRRRSRRKELGIRMGGYGVRGTGKEVVAGRSRGAGRVGKNYAKVFNTCSVRAHVFFDDHKF